MMVPRVGGFDSRIGTTCVTSDDAEPDTTQVVGAIVGACAAGTWRHLHPDDAGALPRGREVRLSGGPERWLDPVRADRRGHVAQEDRADRGAANCEDRADHERQVVATGKRRGGAGAGRG